MLRDRHTQEVDQGVDRLEHVKAETQIFEKGKKVTPKEKSDKLSSSQKSRYSEYCESKDE